MNAADPFMISKATVTSINNQLCFSENGFPPTTTQMQPFKRWLLEVSEFKMCAKKEPLNPEIWGVQVVLLVFHVICGTVRHLSGHQ